jgi:hypothetical protein
VLKLCRARVLRELEALGLGTFSTILPWQRELERELDWLDWQLDGMRGLA